MLDDRIVSSCLAFPCNCHQLMVLENFLVLTKEYFLTFSCLNGEKDFEFTENAKIEIGVLLLMFILIAFCDSII